jgi:peptidyl-prolyl cis-trans isomerase C
MVVLKVNSHQLTAHQFAGDLARRLKHFDALSVKDPGQLKRVKQELVSDFVLESLISDSAKELGIEINEQTVNKTVDELRSGFPDDLAFRRSLAEENISFSDLKVELVRSLTQQQFFSELNKDIPAPNQKDIEIYYSSNRQKFMRKERVLLRQIVVDEIVKAEELRKEIGKKDFAKMAARYSLAPEGKSGGLVGWIERESLDTFEKAFSMPVGAISQPLESRYGFHIFKVEKKSPAGAASLDEVRLQIENQIRAQREQAAFLAWLDKRLRLSTVMRNNEFIDNVSVETRQTL